MFISHKPEHKFIGEIGQNNSTLTIKPSSLISNDSKPIFKMLEEKYTRQPTNFRNKMLQTTVKIIKYNKKHSPLTCTSERHLVYFHMDIPKSLAG